MNNRILAALFALALALFIGVAPVKAEAAHTHVDKDNDYVCDVKGCNEHVHHMTEIEAIEPTCTEAGREAHYYCAGCKFLFTDVEGENQVYSTALVIPATGHNYVWTYDEDEHVKTCTNCDQTFHEAHILTYTDNKDGTHTATCSKCDYEKTEEHYDENGNDFCDPCDAVVHNLKFVEKVEATCTKEGCEAHYKCQNCGRWFKDEQAAEEVTYADCVIEAKGHDLYRVSSGVGTGKHVVLCHDCDYNGGEWECKDTYNTTEADCVCDLCGERMPHVWDGPTMEYHAAKAATCEEAGYPEHEECTICGTWIRYGGTVITEEEKVIPKLEHELKWTADFDGHWQYCTREGCTYTTEKVAHDADAYTYNGNHTHKLNCKTCGGYKASEPCSDKDNDCKCDYCGAEMAHNPSEDTSKFTRIDEKAPTCESAGNKAYYKCNACGGAYLWNGTPVDPVVDALGHTWTYSGYLGNAHLVKCKTCDQNDTLPCEDSDGDCYCDLPVTTGGDECGKLVHSHTYIHVARVEPTCGKEGTEEYLKYAGCGKMFDMDRNPITAPAVIPALEHEWSEDWEIVEGGHAKKCVNCGELQATEAHTDSNGDNRCDVCDAGLRLIEKPGKAATCTDNGFETYWESEITHQKYADPEGKQPISTVKVITKLGHDWSEWESNGLSGHTHHCTRDGCTASETEKHTNVISGCVCDVCFGAIEGHTAAYHGEVPATCTTSGTKAYVSCTCGKMYDVETHEQIEAPIVIPATGHKLSSTLVQDTRLGNHYQVCENEGCYFRAYSDHDYKVEDPLKGNYHQFVCECGYVKTEVHYDKDGDKKCDECGHDMSNTTITVEQHDSVKVTTGEKDKVDNTKTWWQNWWSNITSSNAGSETSGNTTTTTSGSGSTTAGSSSGTSTGTPAASDDSTTTSSGSSGSGSSVEDSGSASVESSSAIDRLILFLTELLNKLIKTR